MKAEIICVGTEILLGDILNTNARYLSQQLAAMGFAVYFQTVVGDNAVRLQEIVAEAKERSDLLLFSGGLGPTEDDLTKQVVAKVFHSDLVMNEALLVNLENYFQTRGSFMAPNNKKQALVPTNGTWLPNANGTAPGIVFFDEGKTAILLPGPPTELEQMFQLRVKPLLQPLQDSVIKSLVLNTFGMGESAIEERVASLLEGENPTAALYAKEGEVHIRITAKAKDEETANQMCAEYAKQFYNEIGRFVYGQNSNGLEYEVVKELTSNKQMIAVAESCTGGLLAQRITSVSGASAVFECGVCSYSEKIKAELLGVSQKDIETYGVVSSRVAAAMAEGVADLADADYGVGITGIAGPSGGTTEKPVGLVYVAVYYKQKIYIKKLQLTGAARSRVRRIATQHALDMVRRLALGIELPKTKAFGAIDIVDDEKEECPKEKQKQR